MRGHRSEAHLPPCRRAHFWDRRVTAKQSPAEQPAGVGMDQPENATSRDGVRTTDNQVQYSRQCGDSDGPVPGFSWCWDNDDKCTSTCNHPRVCEISLHQLQGHTYTHLQTAIPCGGLKVARSRNTGATPSGCPRNCSPSNETKKYEILTEMGNVSGSQGADSF